MRNTLFAGLASLGRLEEDGAVADTAVADPDEILESPEEMETASEAPEVTPVEVEISIQVGAETEEQSAMEEALKQLELLGQQSIMLMKDFDTIETQMNALKVGGMSRQFMMMANANGELDHLFGTTMPACESLDMSGTFTGETYTICMEGFGATMKKWGASIAAFFRRMAKWIGEALARLTSRQKRLEIAIGKIEAASGDLSKVDAKKFGEKKVSALSKKFWDYLKSKNSISKAVGLISGNGLVDDAWLNGISAEKMKEIIDASNPGDINNIASGLGYKYEGGSLKKVAKLASKTDTLNALGWKPSDISSELSTAKAILKDVASFKGIEGALKNKLEAAAKKAEGMERMNEESAANMKNGIKAFQVRLNVLNKLIGATSTGALTAVHGYTAVAGSAFSLVEKKKD